MRHSSRVIRACAVALGLAIAVTFTAGAATVPKSSAQGPAKHGDQDQPIARTVTLITGDQVTLYGADRVTTVPRKGIAFLGYRDNGHQYIIPSDALPLVRDDRLDLRLFDITGLIQSDYDKRDDLPLIVSGGSDAKGLSAQRSLGAISGYATSVARPKLASTWNQTRASLTKGKIWLDGFRKPTLDVSVPQIGAPTAWAAGYDGTGVKVAVLDSGIDATHPDLAGTVIAEQNFAAEAEDSLDHVGHGTHVASTIAGSGAASGGRYRGVAPGAKLLDGKVCFVGGCQDSWILGGMQWAAQSGASVVNMSIGGQDSPGVDPIEQAVNDLTAQYGVLFVVAAGNDGADGTVESPASADAALAVGAVTKTDALADFSSRGPRVGDYALKPEITAPGVDIVAAKSKDSDDGPAGQLYVSHEGTSMATPHVAGAAAILTQVHPQWTAEQRKATLMAAAKPNPTVNVFAQGAGRVDVARAYTQTITTTPASVSFGVQDFPHDDDAVGTRTITYHNSGTTTATVSLALTTTAPAGMFTLNASSLTIPAGGDASVTLTADTRVGGDTTGSLGGQVTATAAGISVQTPFGVVRDIQRAKVHVTATDRAGQPGGERTLTVLVNTATNVGYVSMEPDATLTVVPGNYFASTFVPEPNGGVDLLVYPNLDITGDRDLAMAGRLARPYDITVPDPAAAPLGASVIAVRTVADAGFAAAATVSDYGSLFTAHLGPKNVPGLVFTVSGLFAEPDGGGDFADSPTSYQTGWYSQGAVMDGLVRHLRPSDLATVRAQYGLNAIGGQATRTDYGVAPGVGLVAGIPLPVPALPSRRTEYFAGNLSWQSQFYETAVGSDGMPTGTIANADPVSYVAGHQYTTRWNDAVFGPNLTDAYPDRQTVFRTGDQIVAYPALYSDGSGRRGDTEYQAGRTALYRDGQLVGELASPNGVFDVPPTKARYRLEVRATAPATQRLSTTIESVWTFNSAHVDTMTALPVKGVGFGPSLDENNRAKAGSSAVIPITLSQQGSSVTAVTQLTVDVSYDDGGTWQHATVNQVHGAWTLSLRNPNRAGFVSLRAQATDSAGNTLRQTIIRAYEVA